MAISLRDGSGDAPSNDVRRRLDALVVTKTLPGFRASIAFVVAPVSLRGERVTPNGQEARGSPRLRRCPPIGVFTGIPSRRPLRSRRLTTPPASVAP
jgi:hypothetical protein